jgi:hypothetical protein
MKGMELCRRFYNECVRGIISEKFPELKYSAGLLGFGSDVLGYDDEVSQDHMWGPRLYIFLNEGEKITSEAIYAALSANLPRKFLGYSVGFGEPDEKGISAMGADDGTLRPMVTIQTFGDFLKSNFGIGDVYGLTAAHWLAFSEHKLLSLQAGELFRDDLNISAKLDALKYYPHDVWLYLLMSDWSCLAEERAFVKRTSSRGDALGSRIVCARLAHRIMHLCFLYEKQYATYSKWFGTQFDRLHSAPRIKPLLEKALSADDQLEREAAIAQAQSELIKIHNESGITPHIPNEVHSYYTRDIQVADSDLVSLALESVLNGTALAHLPPVGSLSTVGNLVALTENPENICRIMDFYK